MKLNLLLIALGGAACTLAISGMAEAQQRTGPVRESVFAPNSPQPDRPNLVTPLGMGALAGGAVTGFTGEQARGFTSTGGGWDARLIVGTRSMIAGELAYVGSVQGINAIGLDDSARLLGSGGEILARLNLLPGMFQPYVVGGAGYHNYNIINDSFNQSDIADSDNVFKFPVGAGVAWRYRGVMLDARGVFRPAAGGDLFEPGGGGMQTWRANLNAGVEF